MADMDKRGRYIVPFHIQATVLNVILNVENLELISQTLK